MLWKKNNPDLPEMLKMAYLQLSNYLVNSMLYC